MQAAYKMKEASAKAPKLEVRRGDASRRAAARRQNMARGLLALTMLALVCAVIYSHVQLTELTGKIQDAQAELTAANSWNSYWSNTLDSKTNLRTVEEAATTRLGMIKADPSQITYIKLDETSTVDRPASGLQKLAGMLHAGALSLVGSLNP